MTIFKKMCTYCGVNDAMGSTTICSECSKKLAQKVATEARKQQPPSPAPPQAGEVTQDHREAAIKIGECHAAGELTVRGLAEILASHFPSTPPALTEEEEEVIKRFQRAIDTQGIIRWEDAVEMKSIIDRLRSNQGEREE
jgi:hypothetical protein